MYADKGLVMELTPSLKCVGRIDRFSSAALTFVSSDNKGWGVPVELANVMIYYYKDIFARYNLAVPKTYDDLLQVCRVLKNNGVIPMVLALNKAEWEGAFFFL